VLLNQMLRIGRHIVIPLVFNFSVADLFRTDIYEKEFGYDLA
jgi:hypothetical protein